MSQDESKKALAELRKEAARKAEALLPEDYGVVWFDTDVQLIWQKVWLAELAAMKGDRS